MFAFLSTFFFFLFFFVFFEFLSPAFHWWRETASRVRRKPNRFNRVPSQGFTHFYWVLLGFIGFHRVELSFSGIVWPGLLGFVVFSRFD